LAGAAFPFSRHGKDWRTKLRTPDSENVAVRQGPSAGAIGLSDYTIRVSSREAYVSPTRGAQGNALKTILAMGYVLDREVFKGG
jgi:hypothetical protein